MTLLRSAVVAAALAGLAAAALPAQPVAPLWRPDTLLRDDRDFSFYARGPYRTAVPRPDALLRREVGTWHTQYADQERVLLAIADAAKDRVRVEPIGVTAEGRQMRIYVVTAPENMQRLDAIRADLDRIADPRTGGADLDAVAARTPAVVWFSGSVHGDEVPGFEAAMQLLYHLAASDEPATLAALRNSVVIINPSSNPDGHERFAVWSNSVAVGSPERQALEQQRNQPWSIAGRFNHYRFDMNRDVIASTQQEVRAMVAGMLRWHPMVAADMHGYTPQFFFAPAASPVNRNIGEGTTKWLEVSGRANAEAFDRNGWSYYSRDQFDLYYPGYWDVWPSLTGAAAATFETDGGPALHKRREDGTVLSLRDGIAKHYVAGLATWQATAARSAERVRDYLAFRRQAVADGRSGRMRRVVFLPGQDPARAAELAAALIRGGVEVRRAGAAFQSTRAHGYGEGAPGARRFDAGAYVVDMAQPQGRVARAVLEPDPEMDSVFARTQQEKLRRNRQRGRAESRDDYEFYDITAWALPVAFGVEAYWTEDAPAVGGDPLRLPADSGGTLRAGRADQLPVEIPGGIRGARARSAYLFRPEPTGAPRLAALLLGEGVRVGVADRQIEAAGQRWPRGSYVVRVSRNDTTVHERLDRLAREAGVEVFPAATAFTEREQFGTGSGVVTALQRPRVAIVADEGVSQPGYGAIWWSFERRYGIPFTPVTWASLRGGDLAAFNVLIVPDASPGALQLRLGQPGVDALKGWVRQGNVLVTMGGATTWAAQESVGLTSARRVAPPEPAAGAAGAASGAPSGAARAERSDSARRVAQQSDRAVAALTGIPSPTATADDPEPVPGAHFDVLLDRTHWLTFGYEQPRLTVLFDGSTFLRPSREGTNVAVFPTSGTLRRAGFVWEDNTERLLRGTSLIIDEPLGGGHVVLFNNEPMFRGWWRALDRLVLNAVVLGPAF